METIIEQIDLPSVFDPATWKTRLFKHKVTEEKFRLLVGGIAWPALKPGFGVVLGVSYEDDPIKKIPVLRCLAEIEENSVVTLINECLNLQKRYLVDEWYGDRENHLTEFLYSKNRSLQEINERGLRLLSPFNMRESGGLDYYARHIGENYKEQLLFWDECTKFKGYRDDFSPEAAAKGSPEEYPAIVALGYAVASVRIYKSWEHYGYKDPGPIPPLDPIAGY
jgi:hypothetical protein